ncbi:MAG: 2-oxo acid dehydrogenase subunit E2 [Deltaproteobacteria bacterium]|nr:2-oxo acid dehydrogenase subunit E2 [Deltaproteobacteria bacterium]
MAIELRLPDVGEGVAEGEIVKWLVAEGAAVREDDLLVEVMTDKANVEIPSPVSGVLAKILAGPGQVVKVGEAIALIETAAAVPAPRPEEKKEAPPAPPGRPAPPGEPPPRPPAGEALATPVVRKLAKDLGVDLSQVEGTGPGGRVTEEDVRRTAAAVPAPAAGASLPEERIPFRGRRRLAAKKMVLSKTTVPHALLVDEADATNLLALREALREIALREKVRITILPFIIQAVVTALRVHPAMNASLDEERGEIVRKKYYDIGMAVDAEDGLVVPVIRDAGEKTIVELAREIERLAEAARTGKLALSDLSGGTFTVTSIGSIGGLFSSPVINVPEAAILGVHKIVKRPVVREGAVAARDMMYLSLSFDHRLIDGGTATRFMNDVILQLESMSVE